MVERILLRKRYFVYVGVVTAAIFVMGLLVGYNLDVLKSEFIETETAHAVLESESFVITEAYLQHSADYCRLMETRLPQIGTIIDQLGRDLDSFSQKNMFINYTSLDRRYFLYEIRFWMAVEDYKQRCNKNITTVAFFYRLRDPASADQGIVLTALKEMFRENIYIFSFDADFAHEPLIDILKEEYSIQTIPSLIINKQTHAGPLSKEDVRSILAQP